MLNTIEIPSDLKKLYKHWEKHANYEQSSNVGTDLDSELLAEIEKVITERMLIWERKTIQVLQPPFTDDEVLRKYKFCNIYRELDRQTIEIHTNLQQYENDFELWLLNLLFHRLVCRPETITKIGDLNFDKKNNQAVFERLCQLESPKYGNAYVFPISVIQKSPYPTREEFFCFYLPKIVPAIASEIKKLGNVSVTQALQVLLPIFGFNLRFHFTEVLIDVTYQYPQYIDLFHDFYIGPGALVTAKRLNSKLDPSEVANICANIQLKNFPYLALNGKTVLLSAENWEGIFCEFRKYSNLSSGQGRKRLYKKP